MRKFLNKLHWQVAIALVLAIVLAVFMRWTGLDKTPFGESTEEFLSFIGKLFMRILSMIVVPLVFTSVVCGSMSLGGGKRFLRIGIKTVVFYLATGVAAIILTLLLVNFISPGSVSADAARGILGDAVGAAPQIKAGKFDLSEFVLRMFPPNIIQAAADNTQLLGLIIFAVCIGVFVNLMPERQSHILKDFFNAINALFEKITGAVMRLLPIGVFGLTAPVCMRAGGDVIAPVFMFFITVCLALILHMFVVMSIILRVWGISPIAHIKAMMPSILASFSTSSSVAALPVTLECVENSAGVPKNISGFTVPLGATVNMNGSALYECAAVMFISQLYVSAGGEPLGIVMQFGIMVLALLTSIGVAGIPSASLVAIVLIMGVVGIPAEAVGVIWMTDRILDMMRTSVNVYGDTCAAVCIAKSENFPVYKD